MPLEDHFRSMLQLIDPNPDREGLAETPARMAKAWAEWTSGYQKNAGEILKCFEDGADGCDQMVVVRDIPIYSHCVVGSTFVETPRGRVPIKHLRHNDWIYTMDPKTQELALVRCQFPRITQRNADLVAVHTDNDTLICTPDHRVLTTNGDWVEAQNLVNGQRLASLYRGVQKTSKAGAAYPTLIASRYTRWNDGLKINGASRVIPEHRFVKDFLDPGVYYKPGLSTHHIDERVWNNDPDNLEVMTIGAHNIEHQRTQKFAHSPTRKLAAAQSSGRPDVRARRAASVKAHWDSLKRDEAAYNERRKSMRDGIAEARNHVVFGVERLDYQEDVWCMTVPGTELFFANGIAVHNCEHHGAAIFGTATIGYLPNGKIVGLSKLSRLADMFARRLQVQERMTNQIADALAEHLEPLGCGVVITARHMCMESRGVCQQGTSTVTSALRGSFRDDPQTRAEFLTWTRP